jgi:hypothetical protein
VFCQISNITCWCVIIIYSPGAHPDPSSNPVAKIHRMCSIWKGNKEKTLFLRCKEARLSIGDVSARGKFY